ncbi:heme-binding domain-containing protein [Prolixibacter sp. SD074]|uniref:heme-binding domain-containing protein n=1 Tax=Prolixibacter sp. SD074 TaxID=2652391 RepID=UPI00128A2EB1|nr:heme-binding domain-containing protein [Prolixibacter sp. SD074]GET29509.1 hypothetical protein SD074_17110 [Prolixibacter sp. SD074]
MKKRNLNRSLSISIVLVIVFVGIQYIPVKKEEKENSSKVDFFQENQTPENIKKLLETCYAFNSSPTKESWYTHVAPFSWFLSKQNHRNNNLTSEPYVDPFDSLNNKTYQQQIETLIQFINDLVTEKHSQVKGAVVTFPYWNEHIIEGKEEYLRAKTRYEKTVRNERRSKSPQKKNELQKAITSWAIDMDKGAMNSSWNQWIDDMRNFKVKIRSLSLSSEKDSLKKVLRERLLSRKGLKIMDNIFLHFTGETVGNSKLFKDEKDSSSVSTQNNGLTHGSGLMDLNKYLNAPQFNVYAPKNKQLFKDQADRIAENMNAIFGGGYDANTVREHLADPEYRKELENKVIYYRGKDDAEELFSNKEAIYNYLLTKFYGQKISPEISVETKQRLLEAINYFISLVKPYLKNREGITFDEAVDAYCKLYEIHRNYLSSFTPAERLTSIEDILNGDIYTDAYKFQLLSKINAELPMKYMVGGTIPTIFYYQGNLKSIVNNLMDEYRKGYNEYMVHVAKAYMALRPHMKMLQWKKQVENASVTNWNLVPVQKSPELLNLSMWSKFSDETKHELLQQMINEVQNKMMPPKAYVLLHPEARLADEQRTELINYLRSVDPKN